MSLYKPKGSPYWHYDFVIKGRRFYGSTGQESKPLAREVQRTERQKAALPNQTEDMTLDDACGHYWLEVAKTQPSAETTEYQIENLCRGLGKNTFLTEITDRKLAEWVAKRRGEKSRLNRRISPASVNREVQLLKRILRRAAKVYKANVPNIEWSSHILQEPDARDRTLTETEERKLIEEAADHLKAPIRFALLTGVRLSVAINLNWTQVNLSERYIAYKSKSRKPGGKVHVLPLTTELVALFGNLSPKDRGPVFTLDGKKIKSWRTAWEGAKRRAGVEDFRWHDLRHTAGTRMVRRGVGLSVVQEVLGHADIATTRRYVHHDAKDKLAALEALSRENAAPVDGNSAERKEA